MWSLRPKAGRERLPPLPRESFRGSTPKRIACRRWSFCRLFHLLNKWTTLSTRSLFIWRLRPRYVSEALRKLFFSLSLLQQLNLLQSVGQCIKDLKVAHVVVGTPGRVLHMINEGLLETRDVVIFAMDEADDLLSKGHTDTIRDIFSSLPEVN